MSSFCATERFDQIHPNLSSNILGGAVAEWSKVLLQREEKINKNHKFLDWPPGPGT